MRRETTVMGQFGFLTHGGTKQKFQSDPPETTRGTWQRRKEGLLGRRILLEFFDVAMLDLLHERFAAEKIFFELRGDLARDDGELVARHFGKGNGSARGNQMRAQIGR